jgi:lipopolysaccharide export system protein LptA
MTRHFRNALAVLLAGFVAPAWALKTDRDQPMDVAADRLETSNQTGLARLIGNVRITQGSLVAESATAEVQRNDAGEIARAVLSGSPARLEQALDEGGRLEAVARNIDYDLVAGVVVLTGAVVITQPQGAIRGERVTYTLETGQMVGDGEGGDGRVRLRINPGAAKGKDKAPAEATPAATPAPADGSG